MEKRIYSYTGPVMEFGKCVAWKWEGFTTAPSEAKARSNLKYQFKQETGRIASSKIELPGKLLVVA